MYLSERSSTKTQFWQLTQTKGKSNRVLDLVCFTCRMDWRLTRRATPGSLMWVSTRSWSLARERRNHPSFLELSSFPGMTRHTFANLLQWLWRQQDWCSWLTGSNRTLITARPNITTPLRYCNSRVAVFSPEGKHLHDIRGDWNVVHSLVLYEPEVSGQENWYIQFRPKATLHYTDPYQLSTTAHHFIMSSSSSKFSIR